MTLASQLLFSLPILPLLLPTFPSLLSSPARPVDPAKGPRSPFFFSFLQHWKAAIYLPPPMQPGLRRGRRQRQKMTRKPSSHKKSNNMPHTIPHGRACCAATLISLVLHLFIFTVLHQLPLLLLLRLHLTRSLLSLRFSLCATEVRVITTPADKRWTPAATLRDSRSYLKQDGYWCWNETMFPLSIRAFVNPFHFLSQLPPSHSINTPSPPPNHTHTYRLCSLCTRLPLLDHWEHWEGWATVLVGGRPLTLGCSLVRSSSLFLYHRLAVTIVWPP